MNPTLQKIALTLSLAIAIGTGCHPTQPFYFAQDGDLSHYLGMATEIDYPLESQSPLVDASQTQAPLTLENENFDDFWEVSLADAVKITLANSKVLRSLGGRIDTLSGISQPSEALLTNPDILQTIYNPAIQNSAPGYINGLMTGPEAALAAFDTNFSSGFFWEKFDNPINVNPTEARVLELAQVNVQDILTLQAQLQKTNVTGGTTTVTTQTTYDSNNNPRVLYPNSYRSAIKGEFRQPLLQGMGAEYNRIAGPFSNINGIGTRMFDGVLIARIQTDRALTDFEGGVRNLVADVENAYWELYYAYRNLEARKVGLSSSLRTWQTVQSITAVGAIGGGKEREALAREQYFSFRAQTEQAKSDVFAAENRLRFLMGIAATDGRLIRPSDDPTMAKVTFNWQEILSESLERNVELRKQKWRIKQRELEMIAAKNHLLPRLDMVGSYRWLGFGHDLLGDGGPQPYPSAWDVLFSGDYTESQLGVEMSMTIGFRAELSAVRNAQLLLTRSKAVLNEQELELSHLLSDSVRNLARNYQLIETNFNRRVAAQAQVDTFQAKIDVGFGRNIEQLDLLLEAQRRLAQAEADYYRSLVDYNKAIIQIQFHKGSLLEDNNIFLTEGPWPSKAYFDAIRTARELDASIFLADEPSHPPAVSAGPYQQFMNRDLGFFSEDLLPQGSAVPEEVPAMEPELILPAPEPPQPENREPAKPLQLTGASGPLGGAPAHTDTLSQKIASAIVADAPTSTSVPARSLGPLKALESSTVIRSTTSEQSSAANDVSKFPAAGGFPANPKRPAAEPATAVGAGIKFRR
jgi:outer membrane protein TolC